MFIASIITYNPEINLLEKNIQAVINQVDKIIIIDNDSQNIDCFYRYIQDKYPTISIIKNSKNFGVAKGLNQALEFADKNNYNWLLTLDQDSICDKKMLQEYKTFLEEHLRVMENYLLLCPHINDVNVNSDTKNVKDICEVTVAITSGSLLNVKKAIDIGGFLNKLFIDYVDFEFCLRGKLHGLKVVRLNSAVLHHKLGEIVERKLFGSNIIVTNHSPLRRYYLFRNKIYIYKKYFGKYKKWMLKNVFSSLKTIMIILFYEKNRFKNFKYIFKGVLEGLQMK